MGDLNGAPSVHFNLPLLSFSSKQLSKRGLPLPVSLFLRNGGGLVNEQNRIRQSNQLIYKEIGAAPALQHQNGELFFPIWRPGAGAAPPGH